MAYMSCLAPIGRLTGSLWASGLEPRTFPLGVQRPALYTLCFILILKVILDAVVFQANHIMYGMGMESFWILDIHSPEEITF